MHASPLVSVVMPVLDPHPAYFREALQSILGQTLRAIEVIVVEDPGERSAGVIVASIGDPRIRYCRNPQRTSLVQQRNRGLAEARAEIVAMQDADDIAEPERLAKQRDFLTAHPAIDVLGAQLQVIDGGGARLGYRSYPRDSDAIVRAMRRFNPIAQPAVMFRKAPILAAGGYQYVTHAVEDYELWCRLAERGVRFANHPDALLRYRIHTGANKQKKLRDTIRGTLAIKRQYWRDSMNAGDRLRMAMEYLLLGLPAGFVLGLFLKTQISATLRA